MSYEIKTTPRFDKELKKLSKKYPSLKSEFAQLIDSLSTNPLIGTDLGNNTYKIRLSIASKNKGKSGGARVISVVIHSELEVVLITIYDKSDKESISDKELSILISELNS